MAWLKKDIDLDPIAVEVCKRVPLGERGFTTVVIGEDEVCVRITIDTGKIRTLARRAASAKSGRASLHFGAIVAKVTSRRELSRK